MRRRDVSQPTSASTMIKGAILVAAFVVSASQAQAGPSDPCVLGCRSQHNDCRMAAKLLFANRCDAMLQNCINRCFGAERFNRDAARGRDLRDLGDFRDRRGPPEMRLPPEVRVPPPALRVLPEARIVPEVRLPPAVRVVPPDLRGPPPEGRGLPDMRGSPPDLRGPSRDFRDFRDSRGPRWLGGPGARYRR